MFLQVQILISLAVLATSTPVTTSTIQALNLLTRQSNDVGYLSFCNSCTAANSCSDDYSFHWTTADSTEYGVCGDILGTWESPCELSDTQNDHFDTPLGSALWTPATDCDGGAVDGTWLGQLVGPDLAWMYDCYKDSTGGSYSLFCGQNFACHVDMKCTFTPWPDKVRER